MSAAKSSKNSSTERIATALASAIAGGVLAGLITFFHDEIYAYVSSVFVTGNLYGDYVLEALGYEESTNKWERYDTRVGLMHGGTKVFGTETSARQSWRMFGYFRDPVLALAYENNDRGAVGAGTYTMTRDWPYVLWGHWIGVECDGNTHQKFVAQCPAVLYRMDHANEARQYDEFMKRDCVRITLNSGPCPVRRKADAQPTKERELPPN